jgi:hypothetical protein
MNIKLIFPFIFSLCFLVSCGGIVDENEEIEEPAGLSLKEYGLEADIQISDPKVEVFDVEAKYEQKLLKNKRIEIKTSDNLMLVLNESQENGVEMKVEFAEGFGETVVEKGENYCIIEQEDDEGNPVYDVSIFYEKEESFVEIKVCDPETKAQCKDIDQAKKGLELAKTFKFK